jgi:hypothetical protein
MVVGGKYRSPSNCKPVYIYTKKGSFIKQCNSYTEASLFIFNDINHIGNITRSVKTGICCKNYQLRSVYSTFIEEYPNDLEIKRNKLH